MVALLGACLGVACGGRVEPQGPDGDAGAGSGPQAQGNEAGSGDAPGRGGDNASASTEYPVCPQHPPLASTPCPGAGLGCKYYDLRLATCETWVCPADRSWERAADTCHP
jgi:hypothetical protein